MDELKEEFEVMLKQIHAIRSLVEKALQEVRQKGYDAGYKEGLRMANLGKKGADNELARIKRPVLD